MSAFTRFLRNDISSFFRFLFLPTPPPTPVSETDRAEARTRLLAIRNMMDKHIDANTSIEGHVTSRHLVVSIEDVMLVWDIADKAYWNLK